jgi:hypothetical protein
MSRFDHSNQRVTVITALPYDLPTDLNEIAPAGPSALAPSTFNGFRALAGQP